MGDTLVSLPVILYLMLENKTLLDQVNSSDYTQPHPVIANKLDFLRQWDILG